MSSGREKHFIETREYRRFAEFCDACRQDRYIGLCYGPPGVGKTLSARHYANWDSVSSYHLHQPNRALNLDEVCGTDTIVYTPGIVTTPGQVQQAITALRSHLRDIKMEGIRRRNEHLVISAFNYQASLSSPNTDRWNPPAECIQAEKAYYEAQTDLINLCHAATDPTRLIIVDEADRLKMTGLEQIRDIFDQSQIGVVLIGMPGLEKRLARYPQLYSRVGFVHEYRPMTNEDVRRLLSERHWLASGAGLTEGDLADDGIAAILQATGGNFRLLNRLMKQIERVLSINELKTVTRPVVEAARENLVIGTV